MTWRVHTHARARAAAQRQQACVGSRERHQMREPLSLVRLVTDGGHFGDFCAQALPVWASIQSGLVTVLSL